MRIILRKREKWREYLEHAKCLEKLVNANLRVFFLERCLNNNLIPDFLKFRVPKTSVFSEPAVHSFQLRLLKEELRHARENLENVKDKVANSRRELLENLDRMWLLPVAFNLCTKYRSLIAEHKLKMLSKLEKLSHRQDKPLRETNKIAVKTLDGIELPVFVNEMLSYSPKHPERDKFNEIHFWQMLINWSVPYGRTERPEKSYAK